MAGINRTTGKATDLITFSRASGGTYLDSDGLLKTAATNIPRIEYDADGNVKGLLIEEARTNLVTYSEPSASGFGVFRSSLLTSTVASPDGGFAQKLIEDSSAGLSHYLGTGSLGMSLNTTYTMSWFAKAAERSFIAMNIYSGTTSYWTWFDLSNGTVGSATNSPPTFIHDYGNGWYRCGITVTTAASGTPNTATYIAPSNGVLNYDGDGTSGVYIYGAQLEAGSFPTSYIPTSGATATRSADICSMATSAFGYNQGAGTIVVDVADFQFGSSGFPRAVEIGNSSNGGERINVVVSAASGNFSVFLYTASSPQMGGAVASSISSPFFPRKAALAYKTNDGAAAYDGGIKVTDTTIDVSGTTYPRNTLKIGGSTIATTDQINGHIKSIAYYPRRLSNAQLQALTA